MSSVLVTCKVLSALSGLSSAFDPNKLLRSCLRLGRALCPKTSDYDLPLDPPSPLLTSPHCPWRRNPHATCFAHTVSLLWQRYHSKCAMLAEPIHSEVQLWRMHATLKHCSKPEPGMFHGGRALKSGPLCYTLEPRGIRVLLEKGSAPSYRGLKMLVKKDIWEMAPLPPSPKHPPPQATSSPF